MKLSSAGLICMLTAAAMTMFMDAGEKGQHTETRGAYAHFVQK